MLLIILLSYTNRQSEVCSTRPYMWSFSPYYLLSLKILLSSKTTNFMVDFLPFSILFWLHFLRAQNELSSILQSMKRGIFSCKNISVKVLAKFPKMYSKAVTTSLFLLVSSSVFSQQIDHISTHSRSFWARLVSFDRASKTDIEALLQLQFVFLLLLPKSKGRKSNHIKISFFDL